jgi:hypothetical protein
MQRNLSELLGNKKNSYSGCLQFSLNVNRNLKKKKISGSRSQFSVSRGAQAYHVTRHNTPIHNILSTAAQLSISQKAQGTLTEDDNVMPKHVGTNIT